MLHGFDVSAYQGASVPKADFIFIKATEGKAYTNPKFAAQWTDAKHMGMVRGAYHFARPEQSSGASQADRLLSVAKAVPGEMLCLDLEASDLNQARTNAWAKEFGDRLREKAPGVTTVLYMGSGYASNGTGRDLSKHFDLWWYPQYPSSATTRTWRTSFAPWLPHGLTCGWTKPHIWQFTSAFDGLDASISPLTKAQLTGVSKPVPASAPKAEVNDVPTYVSLGQSKPQTLTTGTVTPAVFDKEYSDAGKSHADGQYPGILSGGKNGAQFIIEVDIANLRGSWRLVEADPAKGYAVSKTYPTHKADGSLASASHVGLCDAGRHLYVELHPSADGPVSVAVKAQCWAR